MVEIRDRIPNSEDIIEIQKYEDLDFNSWVISRVEDGFHLSYFGDTNYMDDTIMLNIFGLMHKYTNHGHYFFNTTDFDDYYQCRDMILNNKTEDIFYTIVDLLQKYAV